MKYLPRKEISLNLSKINSQLAFVQETRNPAQLLCKELDVNLSEQELLGKRLQMMKSFLNDLPSSDPQYSMIQLQLKMDQIELDELKRKEETICEQLRQLK